MRHLALVGVIVSAIALALAQDATAAPTQPSKSLVTVGPGAATDSSTGTMAVQNTSDPSLCFANDPTTGKPVEDPATGHAAVVFAVCDEIKIAVTAPGDVQVCVSYTDMDPLLLGQLDLDAAVYDPAKDEFVTRADGSSSPECLTFNAAAAGTYQGLVVPFVSIASSYTATVTWSAPPPVISQPVRVTRQQINGGGKLGASDSGTQAFNEAHFSLLARDTGSNLGKFSFRIDGVCSFMGTVEVAAFGAFTFGSPNAQSTGGVADADGNGKLNGKAVKFHIVQASDFGEGQNNQDGISEVSFEGTDVPPGCGAAGSQLVNGNLQIHPTTT